jgi:hypothetical protein
MAGKRIGPGIIFTEANTVQEYDQDFLYGHRSLL